MKRVPNMIGYIYIPGFFRVFKEHTVFTGTYRIVGLAGSRYSIDISVVHPDACIRYLKKETVIESLALQELRSLGVHGSYVIAVAHPLMIDQLYAYIQAAVTRRLNGKLFSPCFVYRQAVFLDGGQHLAHRQDGIDLDSRVRLFHPLLPYTPAAQTSAGAS